MNVGLIALFPVNYATSIYGSDVVLSARVQLQISLRTQVSSTPPSTPTNNQHHHVFLRIRQCLEHLCLRQQQQQLQQQRQQHEGLWQQQQQQHQVLGQLQLLRQHGRVVLWLWELGVQQRLEHVRQRQQWQLRVVEVSGQDWRQL